MIKLRPKGYRKKSLAERMRESQYTSKPEIRNGFFKSFDGTRLFYSIEGEGQPLIFCYGLICSSLHWTYQIEHFAKTHQVIWFDYRGHQNSEMPANLDSLTIENMARDLECLIQELKVKNPILLGHSMGVNVVLEYYKNHPDEVKGLVLANGTPSRPLETLFGNNLTDLGFEILSKIYQISPALVRAAWKLQKGSRLSRSLISMAGFNPHLTHPEDIQMYVDQVSEMDPGVLVHLIRNYDFYDARPWLHQIKIPTLVLAGDEDKIIPAAQQELMGQLIPGSQFFKIAHGSHCPQMDLPDLVNLKISRFIDRVTQLTGVKTQSDQGNAQSIQ